MILAYHWFLLDLVDLIQSVITCITAYIIVKHLNNQRIRNNKTANIDENMNLNEDALINSN